MEGTTGSTDDHTREPVQSDMNDSDVIDLEKVEKKQDDLNDGEKKPDEEQKPLEGQATGKIDSSAPPPEEGKPDKSEPEAGPPTNEASVRSNLDSEDVINLKEESDKKPEDTVEEGKKGDQDLPQIEENKEGESVKEEDLGNRNRKESAGSVHSNLGEEDVVVLKAKQENEETKEAAKEEGNPGVIIEDNGDVTMDPGAQGNPTGDGSLIKKPSTAYGRNADEPWTQPDRKKAAQSAKNLKWRRGAGKYRGTKLKDMGEMGVGIHLYFYVLAALAYLFLTISVFSLPSLYFCGIGSGLTNSTEASTSSLSFAQISIANLGDCDSGEDGITVTCKKTDLEGSIFGTISFDDVTYIISGFEWGIALLWMAVTAFLANRIKSIQAEVDAERVTPADFAVYVRGIPPDTTTKDLINHFNERYDLSKEQKTFPIAGMSVQGVGVTFGVIVAIVFGAICGSLLRLWLGDLYGPLASFGAMIVLGCITWGIVVFFKIGKPLPLKTPEEQYDEDVKIVKEEIKRKQLIAEKKKAMKKALKNQTAAVVPMGPEEGQAVVQPQAEVVVEVKEAEAEDQPLLGAQGDAPQEPPSDVAQAVPEKEDRGTVTPTPAPAPEVTKDAKPEETASDQASKPAEDGAVAQPENMKQGESTNQNQPPAVAPQGEQGNPSAQNEVRKDNEVNTKEGEDGNPPKEDSGNPADKEKKEGNSGVPDEKEDETPSTANAANNRKEGEAPVPEQNVSNSDGAPGQKEDGRDKVEQGGGSSANEESQCSNKEELTNETMVEPFEGDNENVPVEKLDLGEKPVDEETREELALKNPTPRKDKNLPPFIPPRPMCEPVLDESNTGLAYFRGTWIADVSLNHPNGKIIRNIQAKKKLLFKTHTTQRAVKMYEHKNKPKKVEEMKKKLDKLNKKMDKLQTKTEKYDVSSLSQTDAAFISFNNEESNARCIHDYRYSYMWYFRYFQPKELQFQKANHVNKNTGKLKNFSLRVEPAPEPSNVLWENLEVGWKEKILRRSLTGLLTFILLVASFIVIYLAQKGKEQVAASMPELTNCATEVPAVFYGSYTAFPANATLQRTKSLDGSCGTNSYYLSYGVNATNLGDLEIPGTNQTLPRRNETSLCDSGCYSYSSTASCDFVSCIVEDWELPTYGGYSCGTYTEGTTVACFCYQTLISSLETEGVMGTLEIMRNEHWDICGSFAQSYTSAFALQILSAVVVVFVNTLLKSILKMLAKFERHASVSGQAAAVTVKIAFAQFLNTAVITLIVNSQISNLASTSFFSTIGLFSGSYNDFNRDWYASIGASLTLTMLINVIVPHIGPLAKCLVVNPLKKFVKRRNAITQDQLDKLYESPKFEIETRYAFVLNCVFVTMVYGGGMPVLYIFAFFNMALSFVIDKLFVVKLNIQPPMYDASLASLFMKSMPIALLIHLAMTCYMYGNTTIMGNDIVGEYAAYVETSNSFWNLVAPKVLKYHVFPLFLTFCLYLIFYVTYKSVLKVLIKIIRNFVAKFFSTCQKNIPELVGLTPRLTGKMIVAMPNEVYEHVHKFGTLPQRYRKLGWELLSDEIDLCKDDPIMQKNWLQTSFLGKSFSGGEPQKTWEYLAEQGLHCYKIGLNKDYKEAIEFVHDFMAAKDIRRGSLMSTPRVVVDVEQGNGQDALQVGEDLLSKQSSVPEEGATAQVIDIGNEGLSNQQEDASLVVDIDKTDQSGNANQHQDQKVSDPKEDAQEHSKEKAIDRKDQSGQAKPAENQAPEESSTNQLDPPKPGEDSNKEEILSMEIKQETENKEEGKEESHREQTSVADGKKDTEVNKVSPAEMKEEAETATKDQNEKKEGAEKVSDEASSSNPSN